MTALLLLLLVAPGGRDRLDELAALQNVVRAAVKRVSPSVVTITTRGGVRPATIPGAGHGGMTAPQRPRDGRKPVDPNAPSSPEGPAPSGGKPHFKNEWEKMLALPGFKKAEGPTTGVIVSGDGYVVTSAWNFESEPTVIVVTLSDGSSHSATLLGIDRAAGLALLKIDAKGLAVPRFLPSGEARVGAWAIAVGRALGREHPEIKLGIISARNRIDGKALQTDAATSPTNYGGPLIDVEGRVFGIVVPLGAQGGEANPNWYDSGIGFAVPIPDPASLVARLGKPGVVLQAAFLGVALDPKWRKPGAAIQSVAPESAAAKAGLQSGDVIVAVDGEPVDNAFALRFAIGRKRAGDRVQLDVERGKKTRKFEVELSSRPQGPPATPKIPVPMPGPKKDK